MEGRERQWGLNVYVRTNAAIRAIPQEIAGGLLSLPAPIQEQANRGFEPSVFLRGFLAAAQQSHPLRCTGDKDEELLGQGFAAAPY